jgi:DNA-binding winged helix-turn-helix (wHTH) protein
VHAPPFHFPELVLRVRALARRTSTAQRRTLRAAGIELDPLGATVSRNGELIDLSAKELAVLEALLKASPGALSAEQLLQQAWDENADPFTDTVRVTIARLRRKLGEPQAIETIRGVGYASRSTAPIAIRAAKPEAQEPQTGKHEIISNREHTTPAFLGLHVHRTQARKQPALRAATRDATRAHPGRD